MSERAWKVYDGPKLSPVFSGIVCVIAEGEKLVAVVTEDGGPVYPDEWQDIARKIAAAPTMLAALKAVNAVGMINPAGSDRVGDAAKAVKAAIDLAEGRS